MYVAMSVLSQKMHYKAVPSPSPYKGNHNMATPRKAKAATAPKAARPPKVPTKPARRTKANTETKGAERTFTITSLLEEGIRQDVIEYGANDITKMHTLRGGSVGAIIGDDQFGCVRKAALRYHGYGIPTDMQTQILMKFGLANEFLIDYYLKKCSWPADRIKRETEIPINYFIGDENVTGRPDVVLLDEEMKPYWGVELKLKGTYYGAKNILLDSKVDTDHIIQALHYMWKHNMTRYSIIYTIPVRFAVQDKDMEAFVATNSCRFRDWDGKPDYANLGFYETIFEWNAERDTLTSFTVHSGIERSGTPLRERHIDAFYELSSSVARRETLGSRPSKKSLVPGQKEWDKCQTCELKPVCDSYENDIDAWWDFAIQQISQEWARRWPELHDTFLNNFGVEPK